MGHLDGHLLSQELLDLLLCHDGGRGGGRGWRWAAAVQVGEGVEPGQGQGTAEGRLHPLPAAGPLPGRLLLLEALDALSLLCDVQAQINRAKWEQNQQSGTYRVTSSSV